MDSFLLLLITTGVFGAGYHILLIGRIFKHSKNKTAFIFPAKIKFFLLAALPLQIGKMFRIIFLIIRSLIGDLEVQHCPTSSGTART